MESPARFPPAAGTRVLRRVVRESGQSPAGSDGPRRACWRHRHRRECRGALEALSRDRDARREAAIGLEARIWQHLRAERPVLPQRRFLERFEPSGRWRRAAPRFGLARGAVIWHLPITGDTRTPAESFDESPWAAASCPAERAWMEAARRARFSFFTVLEVKRSGALLRDCFGELSGRGDLRVRHGEIDTTGLDPGHVVFARIVQLRGESYVDLLQADSTRSAGIADPTRLTRSVWGSRHPLRTRAGMVRALFEAWEREGGTFQATTH